MRDVIREQARGGGGVIRPHGVAQLLVDILKNTHPERGAELREVAKLPDVAEEAIDAARASREYTLAGIQALTRRELRGAYAKLRPQEARVAELGNALKATKSKALTQAVGLDKHTPEQHRDAEWLRDRVLGKMDRLLVGARFLEACGKGNAVFVEAVQRAHDAGMPIVEEETYAQGLDVLIRRSPMGAEIEAQEAELGLLSSVVSQTRVGIQKLAEKHHVNPHEVFATEGGQ